jgi:hypothetical protein
MGLSYRAMFKCDQSMEQIAEFLMRDLGIPDDPTPVGRDPAVPFITLHAEYFQIDVSMTDDISETIWREMLGIEINFEVTFSIGRDFLTQGDGGEQLTRAVVSLLQHTYGDLGLVFDVDFVLMVRKASGISINSEAGFWNPRNRSLLPIPFVAQPLPSV